MPDSRLAFLRSSEPDGDLPIRCSFEHRSQGAEGEVALQYWSPKRGVERAPRHLLLFILGNPGLLDYYIPFLDHLHQTLPPDYALLSASHIGHSPHILAPVKPLDVPAHLDNKVELLKALRLELDEWASTEPDGAKPKLSLMGHSFGAWLLVETMKRAPEAITAGFMLFPSNGWLAETWNGRTTGLIATPLAQAVLPRLSYLLRPILPFAFPVTTQSLLRSPATITHCLTTAASEFEHIREPDLDWFRAQAESDMTSGIFGIWSAGNQDGWVGKEGPMIRECLGGESGGRVEVVDGIPHAFCLRQDHSEIIARVVAAWLEPASCSPPMTPQATVAELPSGASVLPM